MSNCFKFTLFASLFFNLTLCFGAHNKTISKKCDPFQNGFYGGIRGGLSTFHSKSELHSQIANHEPDDFEGLSEADLEELSENPDPELSPYHSKLKQTRGSIGLHIGYFYRLPYENCPLIFSPEIFFIHHPLSVHTKLTDKGELFNYITKTTCSFGSNLRIGILAMPNLFVYGFTGIACSPFKFKVYDDENQQCTKQTRYKPAFTFGVGIEHEMVNTHRIGLELGASCYSKVSFNTSSHDDFFSHSLRIKPKIYAATVKYSVPF